MAGTPFGELIREWRGIRRFSQLDLSHEAEISARHLSFLESGRAAPSRPMVLRLATALQMPREAANAAMHAAGFAKAFSHRATDDAALEPVRKAVAHMLSAHEPYPAVAIDRTWTIIAANAPSVRLFSLVGATGSANMIDALLAAAEGDAIDNWEETAALSLSRLRAEIVAAGGDPVLEQYSERIASHPRVKRFDSSQIDFSQAVIPTIFNVGGEQLSLFSTIAQFGTVQDVAAADLRIEMMFPADDASEHWLRRRAMLADKPA